MKVSLVGPAYPLRGGIAHHVYRLRQLLIARGHDVQVISYRKLYPQLLFPGRTPLDESRKRLDAGAVALLDPLNPLTWRHARRAIQSFEPAAVVVQWWNPFFAPAMGRLARGLRRDGRRVIFECHNVLPHESGAFDRLLLAYAFRPVEYFITHSASDRDELAGFARAKKIGVAPLPEVEAFQSPEAPDRSGRRILFFGLVRPYKGLDVLLRAMPAVLAQVDCRLLVAGEFYEPESRYQRLIEELGIGNKVELRNRYVPNEEVAELFANADVLVLPYVSASQSGVARIALANRLPIIATRAGGLGEVVRHGETGLLVAPGDPQALAAALIDYFRQGMGPRMAARIGESEKGGPSVVELIEEMAGA